MTSFIPYTEKEAFVIDLLTATLQTDDALGICYRGYNYQAVFAYLFLKYYTGVDVENVGIERAFDWLISNCDIRDLYNIAEADLKIIKTMEGDFYSACEKRYEQENSLGQMVKEYVRTDVDTNNAETRELIEKLIDMKGALLEKEQDEKILQFGHKKAAKPVKTGGVKINLSKKS